MNYKYLKGILPRLIVLLMALTLISCGSGGGGGSSSSSAGAETEPGTSEDICNTDVEREDIISLRAESIKIHWDDDDDCDLNYGVNAHYDDDCDSDDDDECDHGKDNDLVKIKIKGELALKCTDYTQLTPIISANINVASSNVIDESIDFQVRGGGSLWLYENNAVYTGIKKFKLNWKGPGFEYDGDITIKAASIGIDKTVLEIDPKSISAPFSVDIGAATIEVDDHGLVSAYPDSYAVLTETGKDGTFTVELLFELVKDMTIYIHQGNETSAISVAGYYLASWADVEVKGYFDPAEFDIITQSADFDFSIIVGDIELTGSAHIEESEWDKSDKTWKYPVKTIP